MSPAPRRLRVVLADDEPLARRALRDVIAADPELELVAECADGAEVVAAVERTAPEILVLDIQMPEVDGFAALRQLAVPRMPAVVFVTAWDEYAVQAFEERALDYVLKPFAPARLRAALDRAKESVRTEERATLARRVLDVAGREIHAGGPPPVAPTPEPLTRLAVAKGDRTVFVPVDDLDWLEAADYYVRLHVGDAHHLVRRSLRWFEEHLDPERFVRIHRSAIVRVDRVRELRRLGPDDHQVILASGRELPTSRAGRAQLLLRMG